MTQANMLVPGLVGVAHYTADPHLGSCAIAETYSQLPQ